MSSVATTVNIVLGVFNAYMLVRSRRVSLMVVPTIPLESSTADPDSYEIRIQVVNLSQFPVYVNEVGVMPRDPADAAIKFLAPDGLPFPFELKPRQSVRLLPAENNFMRVGAGRFRYAYARTACGRTRTGTSPSLQQQELNVLEHSGGTSYELERLRRRHKWEQIASDARSAF
ncbi:hypothetical protein EVC45_02435 [Paraburkholderia sp. UYCP14C]|uniref:hypothetical protein n=1 Tax=Paraburkholderia sp. UYCP14C TaxID=2511130 RepID=UPI00102195A4|nr:hypothetical protein [Paraburkholderia sp. UYCP14C]RZF31330.1 hypothetical protein EVC45_02435 [Paraburkholderia sp. UYCP14C]